MNNEDITVESDTHPRVTDTSLTCSSFAITDIGARRLHNEDAYLCSNAKGLWVVADGMGGHDAGDLASRTLVANLDRIVIPEQLDDAATAVEASLLDTNNELNTIASDTDSNTTIGTTAALLVAREQSGVVMWAGDSRVYRLRNRNLETITRDHSVVNDLLEKGLIDEDQAHDHPDRNKITRSIGINTDIEIDRRNVSIMAGDRYLICSDGIDPFEGVAGMSDDDDDL